MITDLKIALRRLRRAPGFSAVATLTLALAIGANTAVLSIADAVLFRTLPYEDADHVFVVLMMQQRTGDRYTLTPYTHLRLIEQAADTIQGVGLFENVEALVVPSEIGADTVGRAEVTTNYFELLGVRPVHGRLFSANDELGGGRPAVITWRAFQTRFGGDPAIVGRAARLGAETIDVIGVLPRDFIFPTRFAADFGPDTEIVTPRPPMAAGESGGTFHPIVRLRPGVTRQQAEARIAALVAELGGAPDDQFAGTLPVLENVRAILYPAGRPMMRFLLAASLLVLLLGCANLANMLLARTRLREREIGVQAALGAGQVDLLRPLLLEALLLGILGSLAALAMTSLAFGFLLRQVPEGMLGQASVGVDGRVAVLALLLGFVASLAFAALPAWRASRLDAQALLRGTVFGSDRRASFGRPMLAAQVGVAVVLVFGALIATRAFLAVLQIPLGFDATNVIAVSVVPRLEDGNERYAFYLRAVEALASRSEVTVAGASGSLPLINPVPDEGTMSVDGQETNAGIVHFLPGYFDALGIELVSGRLPSRAEVAAGADIAVVSASAARDLFGEGDPLGGEFASNVGRRLTVIGVVSDVTGSLTREARPPAYAVPGEFTRGMTLVIKTRSRNGATLVDIRRQVSAMAPGVPIRAQWWSDQIASVTAYRNPRFQTLVLGSFASLALGLTALGVFGLVAFLVAARMREMGIRMALGAGPPSLIVQALRHALLPTAVGLAAGLLATRALARLAAAQLYEVDTSDPATLVAAAVSVAVAATIAAWLPARRAARVDPMTVLRVD